MKAVLLVLALLLPLPVAGAADLPLFFRHGAKGYSGTQDVTISADGRVENENFGGAHQTDLWQFDGVLLLRFDLSSVPRNAVVKDASLELFCASVGFAPEEKARSWPVSVYECTHEWKEGTGI